MAIKASGYALVCVLLSMSVLCCAQNTIQAANISWDSGVNGDWDDPSKWTGGVVPGPGDDVFIDVNGTFTVTLDAADVSINSLTIGGISGIKTLSVEFRTLTLAADSEVGTFGELRIRNGTISGAGELEIKGHARILNTCTFDNTVRNASGGTIDIDGSTFGAADLRVEGELDNFGKLRITNSDPGIARDSRLTVRAGHSFENATGATVNVIDGTAGGTRRITINDNAAVRNFGTINFAQPAVLDPGNNSDFDNRGHVNVTGGDLTVSQLGTSDFILSSTITVGLGHSLDITGGRFESNGGTVNGAGELKLHSATISGTSTLNPLVDWLMRSCTTNAPITNTERLDINNTSTFTQAFQNATSALVVVLGGLNGDAELRLQSRMDNFGEIRLSNDHPAGSRSATVRLNNAAAHLLNASGATIKIEDGTNGGFRQLVVNANARFENFADVDIDADATMFNNGFGKIRQAGTFNVQGGNLTMQNAGNSEFFNSGTTSIAVGRNALWSSGTFVPEGGSFSGDGLSRFHFTTFDGPADFTNEIQAEFRAVTFNSNFVNSDHASFDNTSTFHAAFSNDPGAVLRIQGGTNGDAEVRINDTGINEGLMIFTNTDPLNPRSARLRIQANKEFTNASGATISLRTGTVSGIRELVAEFNSGFFNFGTINNNVESRFDLNGSLFDNRHNITLTSATIILDMDANARLRNASDIAIGPGLVFDVDNGTVESNGGQFSGDGILKIASSSFEGNDLISQVEMQVRNTTFDTDVFNHEAMLLTGVNDFNNLLVNETTGTINANGSALGGDGLMRLNDSMVNEGLIQIGSDHPSQPRSSTIQVSGNAQFINGTQATISTVTGTNGGARILSLQNASLLRNFGSMFINEESEINSNGGIIDNAGLIEADEFIQINVVGAQAQMQHSGTIDIKANRTLEFRSGKFDNQGGSIIGDGTLRMEFAEFFSSPTFISTIAMEMRSTDVKDNFENEDELLIEGTVTFEADLINRVNGLIGINGTNSGDAVLDLEQSFLNFGQVDLSNTNQFNERTARITIRNTLLNSTGATIATKHGTQGGDRQINIGFAAELSNQGDLIISTNTTISNQGGGLFKNDGLIELDETQLENQQSFSAETQLAGELVISADGRFLIDDGSLFLKNPLISGPGNLELHFVEVDSDAPFINRELITARNTLFKMQMINEKLLRLRGDVKFKLGIINDSPGTVIIESVIADKRAIVRLEAELKNLGTIELDNLDPNQNHITTVIVENGASITSGQGATLDINQTEPGSSEIEFAGSSPKPFSPGQIQLRGEAPLLVDKVPVNTSALQLSGNGSVEFSGPNPGLVQTLLPGASPGRIDLIGEVELATTATYTVELGGTTAVVSHDVVNSSGGNITFDGTLDIDLINGFTPQIGDEFTIVEYESFSGAFDEVQDAGLGGGLLLVPDYRADRLVVVVSDETIVEVSAYMMGLWNGVTHKRSAAIVELREGTDLLTSQLTARRSALISSSGSIRVEFDNVQSDDYWVIVRHGGNFAIASANRLTITQGDVNPIDLTDSAAVSNAVNAMTTVMLNGVNYDVVRTGDFNADQSASADDFIQYFIPNFGVVNPGQVPLLD